MKLFNFLFKKKTPKIRYLKDVQIDELIRIEWNRIQGGFGFLECINNDPKTKKILLETNWINKETNKRNELIIFDYDCKELSNFNLLNPIKKKKEVDKKIDKTDIVELQKEKNQAIEKEDFETADKLQKEINKLLK